jgi:predicted nucleic acid-binding protein
MTVIAVDTSALLSIFKGESEGKAWLDLLYTLSRTKSLIVSTIVLGEIRSFFPNDTVCINAIESLDLRVSDLDQDSSLLAGKIFREYRAKGGPRSTILPDFLVAAHAVTQADALATFDRGYLRAYFPKIRLLQP